MSEILEAIMLISFGASWPFNVYRCYKARTTQGTSLVFLVLVFCGYLAGISAKIISGHITYVLIFYLLNAFLVGLDIGIYFRNRGLDRRAAAGPPLAVCAGKRAGSGSL